MSELIRRSGRNPINPVIEYRVDDNGVVDPGSLELTSSIHKPIHWIDISVVEQWTGVDVRDEGCEDLEISDTDTETFIEGQELHYAWYLMIRLNRDPQGENMKIIYGKRKIRGKILFDVEHKFGRGIHLDDQAVMIIRRILKTYPDAGEF